MTDAGNHSAVSAQSAFHLASLLDLSKRATEYESAEPILNAALLSVMGRFRVHRACILRPNLGRFEAVVTKGVPAIPIPLFDISEPTLAHKIPEMHGLLPLGIYWVIPIDHLGQITALICLGRTYEEVEDNPDVRTYIELMRSILSLLVHNVEAMISLRQSTMEVERSSLLVRSLYEFTRDFTGTMDQRKIIRLLTLRLMGQLMTSSFAILLTEDLGLGPAVVNRPDAEHLTALYPEILKLDRPIRTTDLEDDDPLSEPLRVHNVGMASPMTLHGAVVGILVVCNKLNAQEFTYAELQFLEAVANIVVTAFDNVRLEGERQKMQRLENELEIAATIQSGLLPLQLPETPGLDIGAQTKQSRQIGGDYYDVIQLDETKTLLAIADVSGKGVPAALVMANVQAALNILARLRLPLTQIVDHINKLVYDNTETETFVTMFLAVIDTASSTIEYVNAGHNPPVLITGSDVVLLEAGGVLTGVILDPPPYRCGVGGVKHGDVLVLYTDGVTETFDSNGNEYGIAALVDCVRKNATASADRILQLIQEELSEFSGSQDVLSDDTSIVVVRIQ